MNSEISVERRLEQLPNKVAAPLTQLRSNGHISQETLSVILDAGEVAGEQHRLLGFSVAYLHLQSKGVPIQGVVRMAKSQGRRINLQWSEQRWKQEHDRMSRAETLDRLGEANISYDVSAYEAHLPRSFPGYIIRNSRRLGMEGLRQRHCVGDYHSSIQAGYCAIVAVFANQRRWTVELRLGTDSEEPLQIVQMRSRFNARPSEEESKAIHEALGIASARLENDSGGTVSNDRNYLSTLCQLLPVLREHHVNEISVIFDGSVGEGAIEDIICDPVDTSDVLDMQIEHTSRSTVFENDRWVTVSEETMQPVCQVLEELTDDYLEESDVDWYNDDGGFGTLNIDVTRGTVLLKINVRYTESECAFDQEIDILSGEHL